MIRQLGICDTTPVRLLRSAPAVRLADTTGCRAAGTVASTVACQSGWTDSTRYASCCLRASESSLPAGVDGAASSPSTVVSSVAIDAAVGKRPMST